MKKTLLFLLAITISTVAKAQLKVVSNGNVRIGTPTDTVNNVLSIKSDSYTNTYLEGGHNALRISNTGFSNSYAYDGKRGIYISNYNSQECATYGIYIFPSNNATSSSHVHFGIKSTAAGSSFGNYAISGNLVSSKLYNSNAAAIFGSSAFNTAIPSQYSGVYAGFFQGDVRVTGTIYGTLLTPSGITSTLSTLSNTSAVFNDANEVEGVSDKLQKVQLLQFRREQAIPAEDKMGNENSLSTSVSIERSTNLTAEEKEIAELEASDNTSIPQTILSEVKYGLAADQLKEVFPELVYEDGNGNVSINYIEMVPLLVQSINELKAEIASLKKGNSDASKAKSTTAIATVEEEMEMLSVSQNRPNPFTDKTTIDLSIPESVSKASLFIYDMNGKQVDRIEIAERGVTSISITSAGLTEGMYLYSLVADGKIVSTKRMILTK